MKVGSLFAGIGGFDLAAERAGMEIVWQSELDPHASRVLAHHWPQVPNYGDIHDIEPGRSVPDAEGIRPRMARTTQRRSDKDMGDGRTPTAVDVLTGGFPCQDYSVAGLRGGLAGDRGALWWEFHRLIADLNPTWVVGENVPGLLSSRDGADFETIVRSLTDLGYGVVWRVLDAQWFGVAQRRRRVFIVGHSGGVPRPEVLALGQSVSGDSPPSREARQDFAGTLGGRIARSHTELDGHGAYIVQPGRPMGHDELNDALGDVHHSLRSGTPQSTGVLAFNWQSGQDQLSPRESHIDALHAGQTPAIAFTSKDSGADATRNLSPTLRAMSHDGSHINGGGQVAVAFAQNQRNEVRDLGDKAGAIAAEPGVKQQTYVLQGAGRTSLGANGDGWDKELSYTLNTTDQHGIVHENIGGHLAEADHARALRSVVRRLTPLECERLQGFPDNWTAIPGNSDSQRYRQLGNAVAVPVVEWIMRRIGEES